MTMDFEFNEQQQLFRESFQKFLGDNHDLARHAIVAQADRFDETLWSNLAELGLFAMLVPQNHGGMGLGWVDVALVIEELGKSLIHSPVTDTLVATDIIARYGTSAQQATLLPRIATGALRVVTAIAEPDSDYGTKGIAALVTSAQNGWRLSGTKMLVPHAGTEGLMMVAARAGAGGHLGIALVPPQRTGVQGRPHVTLDPATKLEGVVYSDVSLADSDFLGSHPEAVNAVERLLDLHAGVASLAMVGIAGRMLELSVNYAHERVQFDKPIGSFQAIKHRCADIAVALDAARSAAYYAAWALSEGSSDSAKAVSMAKAYCGDAARMACNEGIQIHGGMGFTWELGLHYYLRRTKLLEFSYGDAAFHRERVLAATLQSLGIAS